MSDPQVTPAASQILLQRRKMRRLQPSYAAKVHRVYTLEKVCELYNISRNTPSNWMKHGLQPIDERRDAAFAGSELNRFHKQRQEDAKQALQPSEIFCIACSEAKSPQPSSIKIKISQNGSRTLTSVCPDCARSIYRFVKAID